MNEIIRKDCLNSLKKLSLEKLKNKTILITGSNGLIGTYLVSLVYVANQTLDLNTKTICVSKNRPNETLASLKDDSDFVFYSKNLVDGFGLVEKIDYVIHGATYAQPKKFLADRLETIKLNTVVTEKLLKLCLENKATFLFLSSSEIYGQPKDDNIPTPETYFGNCSTTSARAAYSESKRLGETICSVFTNTYELDLKIARIASVYGPGISVYDRRVLGNFLNQAILKGHISLLDQGQQIRTWCYVSDCAVMLYNILLYGQSFVYNVGGRDTVSIKQLAEIICDLTNATYSLPSQKRNRDFLKHAPDRVELDIQKIATEFDLGSFVDLRQGLQNTIKWNRDTVLAGTG